MRKRIELGTDIATIGIWDPSRERHDLERVKFRLFDQGLKEEAARGRLFFISTGADGGYDSEFFVNEEIPSNQLEVYSTWNRQFLIICESGRLIAGGVEDFVRLQKQITSTDDEFSIPPGKYGLTVHELQYAELESEHRMIKLLGMDEYEYYSRRSARFPWGCLIFVIGVVLAILSLWIATAVAVLIWFLYVFVKWWRRSSDARLQTLQQRVDDYMSRFPQFLFVLAPLQSGSDARGGWHQL